MIYGVFLAAAIWLPVYAYVEWGAAIAVDAMLAFTGDGVVTRELGFESATSGYRYVYEVALGDQSEVQTIGFHAHAFMLVLFVALVLATPRLGLRGRLQSLLFGGLACFALGVGMLMSDVRDWDQRVYPSGEPPFPAPVGWMAGMHATAGPGLLPVILWAFLSSGPLLGGFGLRSARPAD